MEENSIELKKLQTLTIEQINEYEGLDFFIPAYQRGYRWSSHVETLLDDITNCVDEKYCMQPLMVKWDNIRNKWIVADGQQRLTTIYIICKALELPVNYILSYETRDDVTELFIRNNIFTQQNIESKFKTIDCHFIGKAFQVVSKYKDKEKLKKNISKVQFIWYPLPENANAQDFFDNLNAKKIPLTDAELVKALFLIDSNQSSEWQQKLTVEWDLIERRLHDDKFWFFLREFHSIDQAEYPVRIELILDLCIGLYGKEKSNETHETFLAFEKRKKEIGAKQLWEKVYATFAILDEWYKNDAIYHYAGFLMSLKSSKINRLKELSDEWNAKGQNKETFKEKLLEKLSEIIKVKEQNEKPLFDADEDFLNSYKESFDRKEEKEMFFDTFHLSSLEFSENKNKSKIYDILLLFNILELKPQNADAGNWTNRFRFDLYKQKKGNKSVWSLEHIHAQNEDKDNIIQTIDNMALLTQSDNASNGDKCFLLKRDNIRKLDTEGSFIPQATKNAFLKYYTLNKEKEKIEKYDEKTWNEIDRKCYFLHMVYTFNKNLNNIKKY
jgi:hypothetical protein